MKIVGENIFICLVLFWKCYFLQIFHIFSAIFSASKQILLQKISKSQPNPNTTCHRNSNSTHGSKLQQSKQITTKTALPHHHNNNKNQNHRERSVGRRRDRAEARSSGTVRFGACDHRTRARGSPTTSKTWSGLPLLSLSLCASNPKMVWSENFHFKPFPGSKPHFTQSTSNNFRKIYFSCATKHPHLRKSISRSDLKPKKTQPYFHQLSNQN